MTKAERLQDLVPDAELGHYSILHHIAEGGMGHVFKAYEPSLNREVAIKVLRSEFSDNPRYLKFFDEEAQNIAALRHANIVPIYYIGRQGELYYFVMPFIEGSTLDDWIEEQTRMNLEQAEWVLSQAIDALDWALTHEIVHLDIKPSNFLLDSNGSILLTDFGLARSLNGIDGDAEENRECFGTPAYICPEQILNQHTDQKSDIYSLGATMYHLTTMCFLHDYDTVEQIIMAHLDAPFPYKDAEEAGLPPGWINLFDRMTQKRPEDRFQNYEELRQALIKVDRLAPVSVRFSEEPEDSKAIPVPMRSYGSPEFIHGILNQNLKSWTENQVDQGIEWKRKAVVDAITATSKPLPISESVEALKEIGTEVKEAEVDDVAKALELVPEIRDYVHGLANTSFFGKEGQVITTKKAVRTVGDKLAQGLILFGIYLRDHFPEDRTFNWFPIWQHSLATAVVSNLLIKYISREIHQEEPSKSQQIKEVTGKYLRKFFQADPAYKAFYAGLLHDFGKIILSQIAPYPYYAVLRRAGENMEPVHALESKLMELTHMEAGELWLSRYGFDATTRDAVVHHHDLSARKGPVCAAVALANIMVKRHGIGFSGSPIVDIKEPWGTAAWEELKKYSKNDLLSPGLMEAEFVPMIGQLPNFEKPVPPELSSDFAK
ncbi:MAG: protein kinase [Verrucomicrobiota bacterium]